MSRQDLYVMNVDQEMNYYNYKGFGHIARHCREWENQRRVR